MSIDIKNLSISLSGKRIIDTIDMTCQGGELIALCGANGAGKSTILKAMSGDLPYQGDISINGLDVASSSEKALAQHRAVMPQSVNLIFPFPVDQIIDMGLVFCHSAEQKSAIKQRVKSLFHLQDIWQRDYTQLSGGQQQRVQLARVIAQVLQSDQKQRFLLLDECTSAMDIALMQEVFAVLSELKQEDIGIVAIIHDLNIASLYADRLILLKDQSIFSDGSPADTLNQTSILEVFGAKVDIHIHTEHGRPAILYR